MLTVFYGIDGFAVRDCVNTIGILQVLRCVATRGRGGADESAGRRAVGPRGPNARPSSLPATWPGGRAP